ncbi:hypothetical protein CONPUDRAFT_143565 [Coniophora puteana RWD-64-598 SS2]|uniref:Coilin n=1 Tax=Coniophora puteana (strain RWD-64-598) TaxID=741705 RepID=A0A5M3MSB8_CONPW|nr:uncharacterized protein CONPUDRAFT_143565 [Coniophora puteana RWD-64-598 SS2]EIW81990.1 hypothetical protein CONPUDRAFT_143565 [Coniophora puteana RWD-64-598 SS2]
MRLRVTASPPLPALKAWFPIDISDDGIRTIQALKDALCRDLGPLRDAGAKRGSIALLMDDFELLDDTQIGVLRDGDLVQITRSLAPEAVPAPVIVIPPPPVAAGSKRKRRDPSPSESSSDTSDASSHTDSEESDSDSDSDSDSSDTSSSSSSSTSDTSDSDSDFSATKKLITPRRVAKNLRSRPITAPATSAKPISKKPQPPPPPPSQTATSFTPPGYGKPATRNRNQRRRLKRLHERTTNAQPTLAPTGTSDANLIPLGGAAQPPTPNDHADAEAEAFEDAMDEDAYTHPPDPSTSSPALMMLSYRNKNKKKGFKQSMSRPFPQNIIFSSEDIRSTTPTPILDSESPLSTAKATTTPPLPRLIPPSERTDIPTNILITSIDVEEGLHTRPAVGRKRKKTLKQTWGHVSTPDVSMTLDYGAAEDAPEDQSSFNLTELTATKPTPTPNLDVASIEKRWTVCTPITQRAQLRAGCTVGWKALGINPTTCTPELLLSVGTVLPTSSSDDNAEVELQLVHRPGESSFSAKLSRDSIVNAGSGSASEREGEGEGEAAEDEPGTERYPWAEFLALGARLIV